MVILGIESSCDETAAAVLKKDNNRITILSNIVTSSAPLQAKYGGVIPEQAAREQIKSMIPVIETALHEARITPSELDSIAVTYGPGLIGSLLVGVETAKTLSIIWQKPLIRINHLLGHLSANWIGDKIPAFPCLGLLVSGGHTDLVLFKNHGQYEYLGGTRDDAAGECFDKCARLLNLPYPGGPQISKLAKKGNPQAFNLPRPMIDSKDFDFSFSGLKTAVANLLNNSPVILSTAKNLSRMRDTSNKLRDPSPASPDQDDKTLADLAASIEQAIVDVLVTKTITAVQKYKVEDVIVAGGVAANQKLTRDLRFKIEELGMNIKLHIPPVELCTDNAAMIAAAAFFEKPVKNPLSLQADPNLSLD